MKKPWEEGIPPIVESFLKRVVEAQDVVVAADGRIYLPEAVLARYTELCAEEFCRALRDAGQTVTLHDVAQIHDCALRSFVRASQSLRVTAPSGEFATN